MRPGNRSALGVAAPLDLAVGQVVTDVSGTGFCVHASSAGTEYALVPFFNSGVPSSTLSVDVRGLGLASLTVPNPEVVLSAQLSKAAIPKPGLTPDIAFEQRLRRRERLKGTPRMAAARAAWRNRRAARSGLSASAQTTAGATDVATTVPAIGDLMKLNVNTLSYCDEPDYRTGRVVAITDRSHRRRRHGESLRRIHRRRVPVDWRDVRHPR